MPEYFNDVISSIMTVLGAQGLAILAGLLILGVGWTLAGWAGEAARKYSEKSGRIDATLAPLFAKLTRFTVIGLTFIIALDTAGVDTTALVAFVGAMGLAVGLALKDTIADLASGIVLLILRPFNVGDAVDLGGTLGVVDALDLFETKITSFDGVPIVLPNSRVRTSVIQNYSRATQRRVDLVVGVAYEAQVDRAIETIAQVLEAETRILVEPESMIKVTELGDSSVNLIVRFWTKPDDFFPTKFDTTRAIKLALDEAGIEIPYPKRSLIVTHEERAA